MPDRENILCRIDISVVRDTTHTQSMLDEQLPERSANLGSAALWQDISQLFNTFMRRNS